MLFSSQNLRAPWMLLRIKDNQDLRLLQKFKVFGDAMDRLHIGIAHDQICAIISGRPQSFH